MDFASFYKTQISLTEWLEKINSANVEAFRVEDNEKRDRLRVLNEIIGLPFDRPQPFPATDIANSSPKVTAFIQANENKLTALRLMPNDSKLPKLRIRGITVKEAIEWFNQQKIDPTQYKADFAPHADKMLWTTIFIANKNGIFGEIIQGEPLKLSQGFYGVNEKPILFAFDYTKLTLSPEDPAARAEIMHTIQRLKVENIEKQKMVQEKLNSTFHNHYLQGYFETVTNETPPEMWFVDYNRILGEKYADYHFTLNSNTPTSELKGIVAHKNGKFTGKVRVISQVDATTTLSPTDVLVCPMTTPEYIPFMQQCGAIITDLGGLLSHAAIIARELNKPCIVGTQKATQLLQEGEMIEVDSDTGIIRPIQNPN